MSFLDAARGCEIESVGKSKAEIEAFSTEHGMAGIFEKAEKIKDITQMHFMELDGGKCRTAVYNGKSGMKMQDGFVSQKNMLSCQIEKRFSKL